MEAAYTEPQIRDAVGRLAAAIDRDHEGREVHLVGVLKGSFIFLADLARRLRTPCTVDFVRLSSYGAGTASTGRVFERLARSEPVTDRHVVVVEEIVDSGLTLAKLLADLRAEGPASLRVCALVDKKGRREVEIFVDYRGFERGEGFLVGYGLDLDERYRNLPAIYVWEPTTRKEHPMAIWTCPSCGKERDARCKPKKCPDCGKAGEFTKKGEAKK